MSLPPTVTRLCLHPIIVIASAVVIATSAAADNRVALVVGNSNYQAVASLENPQHDAAAMADRLQDMGFEVILGLDLDAQGFREKIREFGRAVDGADVGLFYYAGHGLQVEGRNYLVHSDAEFRHANDLAFEATDVEFVTAQMEEAVDVSLVILDACRDNPFTRTLRQAMGSSSSRSLTVGSGLAEMRSPSTGRGSAIIYATSPGDVAADGDGRHSPFTAALLHRLAEPGVNIQTMMSRVTEDVVNETNGRQRPWMHSSLIGEVHLHAAEYTTVARGEPEVVRQPTSSERSLHIEPREAAPELADAPGYRLQEQEMLMNMARQSDFIEDYEAYLEVFPDGVFASIARNSIARLEAEEEREPTIQAATESDHEGLNLTRPKVREVQARLRAAGQSPGYADGIWGPRTERALRAWQEAQDIPVTGYLSKEQLALLEERTGERYLAHMPQPQPTRTTTATRRTTAATSRSSPQHSSSAGEAAARAIIGGIAAGILRSR